MKGLREVTVFLSLNSNKTESKGVEGEFGQLIYFSI